MKLYRLPVPEERAADCDSCGEMPARIRLVIGGNAGEKLCAVCIGELSMEIAIALAEALKEYEVH